MRSLATWRVIWMCTVALACRVEGEAADRAANAAEVDAVQNGDFEIDEGSTTAHAISGWTTYGSPTSSVAVVADPVGASGFVLKVSKGKAFCYGLALQPAADYVLKVRVRAQDAAVRIEVDPAVNVKNADLESATTFDWKTVEIPLPAASRPSRGQETWIALGLQATAPGGAAWFDDIRMEPKAGGRDPVSNGSFAEPVLEVTNVPGWLQHLGGADASLDASEKHDGRFSLRITGRGRPVRVVQTLDLSALATRGCKRVRVSAWGQCAGLTAETVKLVVQGSGITLPPVLCLTGTKAWTPGQVTFDLDRVVDGKVMLWIDAPTPFTGSAWFDSVRVQEISDDQSVNLLWNSGFHQASSNSRLPDYWGLFGNALLCVEPWSLDYFGIDDRQTSPVAGTRVLRMHHPSRGSFVPVPPGDRLSFFVPHGGELDPPSGTFTFSAYVKAARAGTIVRIQHPAAREGVSRTIGTSWERVSLSGTDARQLACLYLPNPDSLVWLAAPQLEAGSKATDYRISQGQGNSEPGVLPPLADKAPSQTSIAGSTAGPREPAGPMLEAFAEYDLYTNDRLGRGRIRWAGNTPAEVRGRLIDADSGEVLTDRLVAVDVDPGGEQSFTFDVATLPAGEFAIQAVALTGGKKVARAIDTFHVARDSPREVRSSRFTRSFIVDGRPFFPLFMPIAPTELGDWHLERLVWAGFNTLIAAPARLAYADVARNGLAASEEAELRTQLDRLASNGMRFIWPLSWTFKDWGSIGESHRGDIATVAEAMRQLVRRFRDHPAVIGWYIVDEPSREIWEGRFGFREADLAVLRDVIKATDPSRPCYVNWNHTWAFEPYGGLACTDVISHDNYSISDAPFDLEALVPSVRMLNDERAARKPAIAWISGSYDEMRLRPSPDAVRVHAWLHLVYGTRGLGYWSRPPLDPDVWTEMRRVNRDASSLHENVFGRVDARLVATRLSDRRIHYAVWRVQQRAYVLGVNTAAYPALMQADISSLLGGEPLTVRKLFTPDSAREKFPGVLSEQIPAFQRFVYEFEMEESTAEP